MIAVLTFLGLVACSSAGSWDSNPKPSQPTNLYLPPSQPNNQYLPPSQPEKSYLPPASAPTINRAFAPLSQPTKTYVPPPPAVTPNRAYVPPSAPEKVYLPPSSQPSAPTNLYLPPSNSYSSSSSSGITGAVFRQTLAATKPVAILKQVNENNGDGVYTFSYESEDGTSAEERGQLKAGSAEGIQSAQGSFAFTAPDNVRYTVTYIADENGFQPQGAHLPTPPPIPEAILKSLAENAADEARGIVDDGSYKDESASSGYQRGGYASSQQTSAGYQASSFSQSGYQGSTSSFAQGGYQGSSSLAQSGYQRERPANGGYPRENPSPTFNF